MFCKGEAVLRPVLISGAAVTGRLPHTAGTEARPTGNAACGPRAAWTRVKPRAAIFAISVRIR
jgi:hypothetical protein